MNAVIPMVLIAQTVIAPGPPNSIRLSVPRVVVS
jgi:hypothetical protein